MPLLAVLAYLSSGAAHAQCSGFNGKVIFEGGTGTGHSIISTADGGFATISVSGAFEGNDDDWVLLRLDANLDVVWAKAVGFPGTNEGGRDAILKELPNGNFILGGFRLNPTRRAVVGLFNPEGDLIWARQVQQFYSVPRDFMALADGTFIVVGTINVPEGASEDAYIMKLDETGSILWSHRFDSGVGNDHFFGITDAPDGNLVVAGASVGFDGNHSGMVVEFTQDGTVVGQHTYNEGLLTQIKAINRTSDSHYLLGAQQHSGANRFGIVMKLSPTFEIVWQQKFHQGQVNRVTDVHQAPSGEALAFYSISNNNAATDRFGIVRYDYATGALIDVINPDLDAAHATEVTSQNIVMQTDGSILSVGTDAGNLSLIGIDTCFEYDCEGSMDFDVLNSTYSKVTYSMPFFSCPDMEPVTPFSTEVSTIVPDFECTECLGEVSAAVPDFCVGTAGVLEAELNNTGGEPTAVVWNFFDLGEFEGEELDITFDSEGFYSFTLEVIFANGCEYFYEGELFVASSALPPDLPEQLGYCEGEEVSLDLEPYTNIFDISVNGGTVADNPQYVFPGAGTYTFTFESECASYTYSVEVEEFITEVGVISEEAACTDTPVSVSVPQWTAAAEGTPWTVDFGNGSTEEYTGGALSTEYTSPGSYTIEVSGLAGDCEVFGSAEILIEEGLPDFSLEPAAQICSGETFALDFVAFDFQIFDAQGGTLSSFETGNPGIYTFTAQGVCGVVEQMVVLSVTEFNPLPNGLMRSLCPGKDTLTLAFSSDHYMFQWSTGSTSPDITVSTEGTFAVNVSDSTGLCSHDFSFSVEAIAPNDQIVFPDERLVICEEGPRTLNPRFVGHPYTFPDGSVGFNYTVENSGLVSVTYSDQCYTYEHEVFVELNNCLCPMWVPNAFTPDDDGLNEIFKPVVDCPVVNFRMQLFNRWGKLIFESNDVNEGWNGAVTNSDYYGENELYIYLIRYGQVLNGLVENKEIKGHVSVLR